jgi:protein-S-isoprenylcysteine O-methyltransferase Ste14
MTIGRIQFIRKSVLGAAIAVGVLMFAFTNSTLDAAAVRHEMIEWVGSVAIVVCILGRTWASLYIGGRKVEQFVVLGPYSVMRNPLYFFSILGAFGAGAQLGSLVSGAIFGVLAWIVFYVVIVQEEHLMAKRYGVVFERYVETVPRFLPNPRLWRDEPTLTIIPPRMIRTFADAMILLISVPVAEFFEQLQNDGVLPVLFRLP